MKVLLQNPSVRFRYEIIKEYEAGIVLFGSEVKSLLKSHGDLTQSFAIFKSNELFLLNLHINRYKFTNFFNHEENRTRKLLMHRREIQHLFERCKKEHLQLIPLLVYIAKRKIKVKLALAKGKKIIDKRRTIKERELKRELSRY